MRGPLVPPRQLAMKARGVRLERVEAGPAEEAEGEGTEASPRLPKADSHSRAPHEAVARILEDDLLEGGGLDGGNAEGGAGGGGSAEEGGAGGGAVGEMAWSGLGQGQGQSSRSKFEPVRWQEYFEEEDTACLVVFHSLPSPPLPGLPLPSPPLPSPPLPSPPLPSPPLPSPPLPAPPPPDPPLLVPYAFPPAHASLSRPSPDLPSFSTHSPVCLWGQVFHVYRAGRTGPVLLCLHGGGYAGASFAVAAGHMRGEVQVVAVDMRGHGATRTANDLDLSAQTLVEDVAGVARKLFGDSPPAIVLLGHSMGGAVAVRVAEQQLLPSLAGLVVVDVVEGSAVASLGHMHAVLASRPSHFPSLHKAVEWSVRSGHLRSVESARVSVPPTLVPDAAGKGFVWRTPLEKSQPYWKGWYTGLSDLFLRCPVPKLLLLAGTDRLDKPLTIAQMQGRFQMLLVRHSGHAIQEDESLEFSSSVLHFIARNRITQRGVMVGGFIHQ
ncbi:unnamed protein product [Closterium sp. NIES-64]|nr:unnamed protein product [Closterium sp. NIES-64]